MVAKSLSELRDAFKDDRFAAEFSREFIAIYGSTALGSLPKSEIDQLVFDLLVRHKVIDTDGPTYRIARALNVTPSKAKALLFQHQLRHVTEDETDHQVMMAITTARYWKDGDKLSFGVSSPLVKAAISAKMEERGVFADVSLSGNILRVDPERFGEVLSNLIAPDRAESLLRHLKSRKIVDDKTLKAAIAAKGSALAGKFVEKGADAGFDEFMAALGSAFEGEGPANILGEILDAVA